MFDGKLPECFNRLSSIKLFDISSNQLTGVPLPSLITNLTSLEYIDFRNNKFEGSFSLSWFSNLTNLEFVAIGSDNENFEVEIEEPVGWTCMFQLKVLILSHCNLNKHKGSVIPSFLLHQYKLRELDMSHNSLKGQFPDWLIKNNAMLQVLILGDNSFSGKLSASFHRNPNTKWLDVSRNNMMGLIPNDIQESLPYLYHLNLSRNSINGVIPSSIGDLSVLQELDLSHNWLSGEVPIGLLTNLSHLKMLILSNNSLHGEVLSRNFKLSCLSSLHLDNNHFTGSVFSTPYLYSSSLYIHRNFHPYALFRIEDEILFTTKTLSMAYKGDVLDIMSGLDLSCNKLTGNIPEELGLLAQIHALNLSHNMLIGPIPVKFSNLANIESLDLSFNSLTGKVPSELIKLNSLAVFNVSFNNLSGRLPERKAQFITFSKESYEGNPLLCGLPLENECIMEPPGPQPSNKEASDEKWHDMDMASFYGSCSSTWFVIMLGFAAVLYVNRYWRRWWFHLVEESDHYVAILHDLPSQTGNALP
ncbi:hypothetical protein E3N88_22972 [Mikania micrantha]|uniref:Leucine-rich repeat-containing N-terminal plant-type domain-containing protein n=1 Tax=Mikania micrantha TaxID=192012 RepID=A0A5N6NBZ1_9ASTR|nr:hypothetical protein E3N88_22972 [Mikania micrantha]